VRVSVVLEGGIVAFPPKSKNSTKFWLPDIKGENKKTKRQLPTVGSRQHRRCKPVNRFKRGRGGDSWGGLN